MRPSNLLSLALLASCAVLGVLSFAPSSHSSTSKSALSLSSQESAEGEDDGSRRGFFKKVAGGAVLTGIIANGISVQGGNTGLGLESAKRLAAAGATIVLTSRSAEKGARAVQTVKEYVAEQNGSESANVYSLPLDLCDLESVKAFPDLLKNSDAFQKTNYIDVLLNNAGVMAVPDLQITKDGYEKTFQSNHLGHFALTGLLTPLMNDVDGSRIVNVSSMAHLIASKGLDMENLNGEVDYQPWNAYGMSKLENILFTKELQRRADVSGKKITAVSLHPGAVRTDLPRYIIGEDKFISMQDGSPSVTDTLKALPAFYFTKNVRRGANSQVYLSAGNGDDRDIAGKFFVNMKEAKVAAAAMDMEKAKELWKASEKLSGVEYTF